MNVDKLDLKDMMCYYKFLVKKNFTINFTINGPRGLAGNPWHEPVASSLIHVLGRKFVDR